LQWLASHDQQGRTIIDYGCGSGILAIAALLLGATHADAVDIDPQALTATRNNADKNQIQDRIDCHLAEQFNVSPADTLVANILAKPLIELAGNLASLVRPGGYIVLSGILKEQSATVVSAYQPFFKLLPTAYQDDWCRIVGTKLESP
jgi:ribosomal protein L11 methyltransferase